VFQTPAPDDDVAPTELTSHGPHRAAAGLTAVGVSVNRAREQMGLARSVRSLARLNQADGFDCMGCAWPDPDPDARSVAEFCENGVKAVAEEATLRRIGRDFFQAHPLEDLERRSDYWLGQQGRLTEPMVRRPGSSRYEPISWGEAVDLVASQLRALPSPNRAIFYTSGRTSNEAAFVYQLFARALGTNNLPDCSNMCHESTSVALAEAIGIGKGSVSLDDVEGAQLIVICGQNPGTNHPRMLTALEHAKRRGARILAVNPLPEAGLMRFRNPKTPRGLSGIGTALADLHLPIRVNGDLALFQGIGALLVERDRAAGVAGRPVLDHDFIARYTTGFEAWRDHVGDLDWAALTEASGLSRQQIEAAADLFAGSARTVICWAMGITQHRNAVATIKEIVNVCLVQGNIGKPGAGLCPVRGHSNVQGDRTMGIWEKLPAHFGDALRAEFGFEPPRERGLDTVDAIRALRDGRASVFVGLGGNFARATPDTAVVEQALRRADLTVQISTKLNRSHVVAGRTALILPTQGRTERDERNGRVHAVSVEDSMSAVHLSRGVLAPASEHLRSEVDIVCAIAEATLRDRPDATGRIDWAAMSADYEVIRTRIEHTVPGCAAYSAKLAEPGGFVLPHPPRDSRTFPTASGRAEFTVSPLETVHVPSGHLLLQSLRSHDQFNTTIYGHDDRYRGIEGGRNVVLVHPDDVTALGLAEHAVVDLVGTCADGVRVAHGFRVVLYPVARGCAAAYYPEVNVLVPLDSTAIGSNCPTSKSVVVQLVPIRDPRVERVVQGGKPVGADDHHKSPVEPYHLS